MVAFRPEARKTIKILKLWPANVKKNILIDLLLQSLYFWCCVASFLSWLLCVLSLIRWQRGGQESKANEWTYIFLFLRLKSTGILRFAWLY